MRQKTYPKRTQISLSLELKRLIEAHGAAVAESLSEYLRKAAMLRMALEDVEKDDLKRVAMTVVGSVPKQRGGWSREKSASLWQRHTRRDENRHRS